MLLLILVILLILAFGGAVWGSPRYGWWGIGPFGLLLIILLVLWLAGVIHV